MSLSHKSLGDCFASIVIKNPKKIAIVHASEGNLTYKELDDSSNKFYEFIRKNNKQRERPVLIFDDKSLNLYSAILGCIKLGKPYLVVDTDTPAERLNIIIKETQAEFLIINRSYEALVVGNIDQKISKYYFDTITKEVFLSDLLEKKALANSSSIAYIIFTSGSTGKPKAIPISHANLYPFINWSHEEFSISSNSVCTSLNQPFFDNFVFDFYCTIFNGATLISFNKSELNNLQNVYKRIVKNNVTHWFSVPSLLIFYQALGFFKNEIVSLKKVIFGGEGYPIPKLKKLIDDIETYDKTKQLYNVYGPSECTCMCSSMLIKESLLNGDGYHPIGKISDYFKWYLETEKNDIDQIEGVLCLAGQSVSKGYINRSDDKSFFKKNSRLFYRTGDIFKIDHRGDLNFVAREDFQIKRMGYRVDLIEVEHTLNKLECVSETVVVSHMKNDLSYITAFFSPNKLKDFDINDVQNFLRKNLPKYMLPNKIESIENIKKNANGKIDRSYYQELAESK